MFWAKAAAPDGTTYIGIVSDSDARKVHHWLNIDDSQPDCIELPSIAVISTPPGEVSVESTWGAGNLILSKYISNGVWIRTVSLDINSGAPFMVDRWISGLPQFIFFPGINRYPQHLRRCLPATLTQVSQIRASSVYTDGRRNNNGDSGREEDTDRDGGVT